MRNKLLLKQSVSLCLRKNCCHKYIKTYTFVFPPPQSPLQLHVHGPVPQNSVMTSFRDFQRLGTADNLPTHFTRELLPRQCRPSRRLLLAVPPQDRRSWALSFLPLLALEVETTSSARRSSRPAAVLLGSAFHPHPADLLPWKSQASGEIQVMAAMQEVPVRWTGQRHAGRSGARLATSQHNYNSQLPN